MFVCLVFNVPVNLEVTSETALGTIESVLPHCGVRSACVYHTQSHDTDTGPTRLNTNLKVLGWTRSGIEPRTSRSLSECFTARPQSSSVIMNRLMFLPSLKGRVVAITHDSNKTSQN
ncbi:hypothetical protein ElyMa_000718000 [Elysia marginata]|uniref:Uncharacterized protein n=1 Tax=Elysia marginata TaxID=1093978 RepID=A0AAV4GLY3_9GAST|nr:hypothetical protein ElyMa_000718000 [Elysia marginata]